MILASFPCRDAGQRAWYPGSEDGSVVLPYPFSLLALGDVETDGQRGGTSMDVPVPGTALSPCED